MKTNRRLWLFLLAIFMAIMLPGRALAQDKIDLSLSFVQGNYYQNVKPGENNKFFIEVRNSGDKLLTNIKLSADEPQGWTVEFKPAEYASLSPGTVQTAEVNIVPKSKEQRGQYQITFIAEAAETRRVMNVWFTVESNSLWLKIGAVVAFIVAGLFIFIFLKFGRQR